MVIVTRKTLRNWNIDDTSGNSIIINDFVAVKCGTELSGKKFFAKLNEIEIDEIYVEYMQRNDNCYQYPVRSNESWQI